MRFVIIMAGRNCERYVAKSLQSALYQRYEDFRVFFTDDTSTDHTFSRAQSVVDCHPRGKRVTLLRNTERRFLCANHVAMLACCEDGEVAVFLDGDDWFSHPFVLRILGRMYSDSQVWCTYGQYEYSGHSRNPHGSRLEVAGQMPPFNHTRRAGFLCGALRTCYVWLFKKIRECDLKLNGKWVYPCSDLAIMFPIVEMAGPVHSRFIPEPLYVYNRANPHAVSIEDGERQQQIRAIIESGIPYLPLAGRSDVTRKEGEDNPPSVGGF